jgi:hypothetical protein
VVVRNGLEHGIPGLERIVLRLGVAAAEKIRAGKLQNTSGRLRKYGIESRLCG